VKKTDYGSNTEIAGHSMTLWNQPR
jgi:hypothetical protein